MRKILLQLSVALVCFLGFASFSPAAFAQCNPTDTKSAIECGTSNVSGIPVTNNPQDSIDTTITQILKILSTVVGIISVVMIVVGGFKFMTSGGDSSKIASARTTVLYALIGLVVIAVSQIIIKFVLLKTATA